MRGEVGVRGAEPCNRACTPVSVVGNSARAQYLAGMLRLSLVLAVLSALFVAGPAAATAPPPEDPTATPPAAVPAQTETTPEDDPDGEDDPDEEEIGRDFEAPPEDTEPEQEEAPEVDAAPPAPAPVPAAAPAELPRTGTDQRLLLAAAVMVLAGFALRRVVRPR